MNAILESCGNGAGGWGFGAVTAGGAAGGCAFGAVTTGGVAGGCAFGATVCANPGAESASVSAAATTEIFKTLIEIIPLR